MFFGDFREFLKYLPTPTLTITLLYLHLVIVLSQLLGSQTHFYKVKLFRNIK